MMRTTVHAVAAAIALTVSGFATAGEMTCSDSVTWNPPGPVNSETVTREWTWDSADACGTLLGTPMTVAKIQSLGGLFNDAWVAAGEVTDSVDNTALNIGFTTGSFGNKPATGTWSLSAGFWDTIAKAVVTIHVGGGQPNTLDDHGVFLITPSSYSGFWEFTQTNGNGGGISNFKLWTIDKDGDDPFPTPTPEPATLMLLGSALVGLGLRRRKTK